MSEEHKPDYYEFPTCMHVLSAALHRHNVAPQKVIISMPWDEWWKLANALEQRFKHIMTWDGRTGSGDLDEFRFLGFTFRWNKEATARAERRL